MSIPRVFGMVEQEKTKHDGQSEFIALWEPWMSQITLKAFKFEPWIPEMDNNTDEESRS